jgi:hypothetical protein
MVGKPADELPSGRPADIGDQGGAHDPRGEQQSERTGPVTIARHVKDDGRALILYTRDPSAQP